VISFNGLFFCFLRFEQFGVSLVDFFAPCSVFVVLGTSRLSVESRCKAVGKAWASPCTVARPLVVEKFLRTAAAIRIDRFHRHLRSGSARHSNRNSSLGSSSSTVMGQGYGRVVQPSGCEAESNWFQIDAITPANKEAVAIVQPSMLTERRQTNCSCPSVTYIQERRKRKDSY